MVDEACFPYTASDQPCVNKCNNPKDQIKIDFLNCCFADEGEEVIKKAIIDYGPITMGIRSWFHFMVLVGFDKDKDTGETIWIFKNSWGSGWGDNGYGYLKVPLDDFYGENKIITPVSSLITPIEIACNDFDGDGYYNWGISEDKPVSCPASALPDKDCDDNNPSLGPFDTDGHCVPIRNSLLYTPVMPCCAVDTRKTSAGIIDANTERDFHVFGSAATISAQGGNAAGCPSPAGEPMAAHINMIAVNPTGKGNLQAFPVGAGPGAGLSVNYNTIDTNLANAGNVGTVTGAGPDITVTSRFSDTHAVLSVAGYYYPMGDLRYTPITPCKIVDTRNTAAGIISAFAQRNFHVFGSAATISAQGGNAAGCSSPTGEPMAAHINLIAVNPTGKGNLQAFPMGAGPGAGLSVNYNTIDTNLANAGNVGTVTGAGPDITVTSRFSDTHAVLSVAGYYYPAP